MIDTPNSKNYRSKLLILYQWRNNEIIMSSMCAFPLSAGGGGLNLQPNFKKGSAWQGVTFFEEELQFSQKSKIKSEIFNGKKRKTEKPI